MLSKPAALAAQDRLLELHRLDHHHMGVDDVRIHQID
jgi:hypothetical protein